MSPNNISHIKNSMLTRIKERGSQTVHVGIGIAITAIMLVAASAGFRYQQNARAANDVQMLNSLKLATVDYGMSISTGIFSSTNVTIPILGDAHFFDDPTLFYTSGASSVTNQWGGTLSVAVGSVFTTGDSIIFTSTNIPKAACIDIGMESDAFAQIIKVNNAVTKPSGTLTSVTSITAACTATANTMEFTIMK